MVNEQFLHKTIGSLFRRLFENDLDVFLFHIIDVRLKTEKQRTYDMTVYFQRLKFFNIKQRKSLCFTIQQFKLHPVCGGGKKVLIIYFLEGLGVKRIGSRYDIKIVFEAIPCGRVLDGAGWH